MPVYTYSPEKNFKLILERRISFEEIIVAIESNQVLDVLEHPDQRKYKNQKIYVVYANEYVYLVPFVTDGRGDIFLKTIIPSRKAKQKYIHLGESNEKK